MDFLVLGIVLLAWYFAAYIPLVALAVAIAAFVYVEVQSKKKKLTVLLRIVQIVSILMTIAVVGPFILVKLV